jgi:hypothetical protein
LYGCETWSLTLREGHRMQVFANRVLRKIFGPKWHEVTGEGEGCVKGGALLRWSNQEICDGQGMWHVWGTGKLHTVIWRANLKERDRLEDLGVNRRIILKWIFKKLYVGYGPNWTSLLVEQEQVASSFECGNETSGSVKCGGISWVAGDLSASWEGLCSMELFTMSKSQYISCDSWSFSLYLYYTYIFYGSFHASFSTSLS